MGITSNGGGGGGREKESTEADFKRMSNNVQ